MRESRAVQIALNWLVRIAFLCPALLLAILAIPRFESGIAAEAAFPVPAYLQIGKYVERNTYVAAAKALSGASGDDGESTLQEAEALLFAGAPSSDVEALLRNGLLKNPASARGWTLLAERLMLHDRTHAAGALTHAILLGHLESGLIGRQARSAALLWDALPASTRQTVLGQVRTISTTPSLRTQILSLLFTTDGQRLVSLAFAEDPEGLRALNEWAEAYRQRVLRGV